MEKMKIILASQSPRRSELLSHLGVEFEVMPSGAVEDNNEKIKLTELSKKLAFIKAKDVFDKTSGNRVVIGSDTLVAFKNKIFGKPKNKQDAFEMLSLLSNKTHKVITSLCVMIEKNGEIKTITTFDTTKVKFIKLDKASIEHYLNDDEFKDKAGAYAIQGKAGLFIKEISGDYNSIVGLPVSKLNRILKSFFNI